MKSIIFLCLIGLCLAQQIVVQKTTLSPRIFVDSHMVINVKIFNVGEVPIYNIKLIDEDNWPASHFTDAIGIPNAEWDHLAAGENITHTYVVVPQQAGVFKFPPAVVTYRAGSAEATTEGIVSSTPGYMYVEPANDFVNRSAPHLREWAIFFILAVGSLSLPFAVLRYYQTNYEKGIKKSK
eukprot:TRINITY_DN1089_c0_g1_i1.p1 TRINITY_DN1089_c0_g1~~TRINITY_DN1089_c0_g1_i1.p1  ORF type:complete len:181 (+),score=41.33 TRINITY_DN1089_c0_g1_i1:81-623(+)